MGSEVRSIPGGMERKIYPCSDSEQYESSHMYKALFELSLFPPVQNIQHQLLLIIAFQSPIYCSRPLSPSYPTHASSCIISKPPSLSSSSDCSQSVPPTPTPTPSTAVTATAAKTIQTHPLHKSEASPLYSPATPSLTPAMKTASKTSAPWPKTNQPSTPASATIPKKKATSISTTSSKPATF